MAPEIARPEAAGSTEEPIRLYDSHAHLVSDDLERYPRNPFRLVLTDGKPAIRPPFGPGTLGIPGGMHGPSPINEKPTAEQMRCWMAEENVVGIAAVQKGMIYGTDNSYIVDAAQAHPDRMSAVVILDPEVAETPEILRDLAGRGAVSIRFFPVNVADKAAWLSSPASLAVWTVADELGLVVDLEAPPYDALLMIPVVEAMADRFPNLSIVLDHIFMPIVTDPDFGIDARFDGFAARDNISVKFTSLNMDVIREQGVAPEDVLRRAVDFFGADKVMWGSDIGTSSGTYKEMVARAIAASALLNAEERRKVLHDTGRRIFVGWDGEVA
jgi:predicted TIM-barrel fold metal-dependent hydrolase